MHYCEILNMVENPKTGKFTRAESLRLRSEIQHVFKQSKVYGKYFTCLYTVSHSCEVVPVDHPRYDKLFGYNRDAYVKVLRRAGVLPEEAHIDAGSSTDIGSSTDTASGTDIASSNGDACSTSYNDTAIAVGILGVSGFRKVGFVVSKKVHRRANVRNHVKRQMRHLYRLNRHNLPLGTKMIVIAHKRAIDAETTFDQMHQDFRHITERIASFTQKGSASSS